MAIDYSVHGSVDITIDGNILVIESVGPWNIEYFNNFHLKIGQYLSKVDPTNYAVLLKLVGEAMAGQDCIDSHLAFIKQGNVKAIAVNFEQCTSQAISRVLIHKIYQDANIEHEYFENDKEALDWLQTKLV